METDDSSVESVIVIGEGTLKPGRHAPHEPAVASTYIVTGTKVDWNARLRLRGDGANPFWAFLTITNNDTQQVTMIRPQ